MKNLWVSCLHLAYKFAILLCYMIICPNCKLGYYIGLPCCHFNVWNNGGGEEDGIESWFWCRHRLQTLQTPSGWSSWCSPADPPFPCPSETATTKAFWKRQAEGEAREAPWKATAWEANKKAIAAIWKVNLDERKLKWFSEWISMCLSQIG